MPTDNGGSTDMRTTVNTPMYKTTPKNQKRHPVRNLRHVLKMLNESLRLNFIKTTSQINQS